MEQSATRTLIIAAGLLLGFLANQHLIRPIWTTLQWNHTEGQRRSLDGRYQIALASIRIMKSHLWLGRGIGNFAHSNVGTLRSIKEEYTAQPFNWFLQMGVEEGLVGFGAALALLTVPIFSLIRQLFKRSETPLWAVAALIGTGAMGCFAIGQGALFGNRHLADLNMTWLAVMANETEKLVGVTVTTVDVDWMVPSDCFGTDAHI